MALNPILFDQLAFILFLAFSIGYHFFYLAFMKQHPAWSARARMHEHRANWVAVVLKRGERVMAVQSLRNLIMVNTFLASTMLLLVAFIANFVVLSPSATPFEHPNPSYFTGAMPVSIKGTILMVFYAFAFIMFLTVLRSLTHLSLLMGIEPDQMRTTERQDPVQFLSNKLNQVESLATYGRRAMYFSIPLFGWFFSPWLFALLSLTIWLYFVLALDFVWPNRNKSAKASEDKVPAGLPTFR